jgi:hypothetical protein
MGAFMDRTGRLPTTQPPRVELTWSFLHRRGFLESVDTISPRPRLTYSGKLPGGTQVVCVARIQGEEEVFRLSGCVTHTTASPWPARSSVGPTITVEIDDAGLTDFKQAYAMTRGLPRTYGRRSDIRLPVRIPARCIEAPGSPLIVTEISRGGASIEGCCPAPRGSLELWVNVSWWRSIRIVGRVAWSHRRAFGIDLQDLEAGARASLLRSVPRRRAPGLSQTLLKLKWRPKSP